MAPAGRAEHLRKAAAERKRSAQTIAQLIDRAEKLSFEAIYFASDVGRNALEVARKEVASSEENLETAKRAFDVATSGVLAEQNSDRFAAQMIALLAHGEEIGLTEVIALSAMRHGRIQNLRVQRVGRERITRGRVVLPLRINQPSAKIGAAMSITSTMPLLAGSSICSRLEVICSQHELGCN